MSYAKPACVMTPSAVKCTNAFPMCGYCDFCPGFLRQGAKTFNTAAENQLCPTGAIKRKFVEEPYFEYTIDEKLCDGCSKCVKGCADFGNGSLYLQIMHNLCVNCNQCRIARNMSVRCSYKGTRPIGIHIVQERVKVQRLKKS